MKPRILFLVPSDYAALQRKGVDRAIRERDEHGFFERVVTVHPIAQHSQVVDLGPVHRLIEFDLGRALAPGARWWVCLSAPVRALVLFGRLIGLMHRERIDVIRATDPYLMGLLAWAVARITGRPFCVSIHGDYGKNFELTPKRGRAGWLRRISAWCPPFVLRRADLVLPIRRHLARWAESQGAPPSRTRIIPHGLDLTPFANRLGTDDVRGRYRVPAHAPIISFVGRLSRYNYVHDVLEVAERVLARRPDAVFILMGDGEERSRLEQCVASSAALAQAMRMIGFQSQDEVIALRLVSAVSLCPMGGFSLLEACAAGSAVAAYDVDWHHEIITHDSTGLLVREGDIEALAAAVVRLLDDRALATRLGMNARAFVEAHHNEPRTSAIKCDCYRELLRPGKAA